MSNMRYYTNVVPTSLYSKLLEKGMPADLVTYAEVFDWLMTKGVIVYIYPDRYSYEGIDMWRYTCYSNYEIVSALAYGWIESADDAIHYTLEQLI